MWKKCFFWCNHFCNACMYAISKVYENCVVTMYAFQRKFYAKLNSLKLAFSTAFEVSLCIHRPDRTGTNILTLIVSRQLSLGCCLCSFFKKNSKFSIRILLCFVSKRNKSFSFFLIKKLKLQAISVCFI